MKSLLSLIALSFVSVIALADPGSPERCTACRVVQSAFGIEPIEPFFRYDLVRNGQVVSRWDFVERSECNAHRKSNSDCGDGDFDRLVGVSTVSIPSLVRLKPNRVGTLPVVLGR